MMLGSIVARGVGRLKDVEIVKTHCFDFGAHQK